MKKLLFILLLLPFLSIGQSKKELKNIVLQQKGSIADLEDKILSFASREVDINKAIDELTNKIKKLEKEKNDFIQKANILNSEKSKLEDENNDLQIDLNDCTENEWQIDKLEQEILVLEDEYELLNVKIKKEFSLKGVVVSSKFSKKKLAGSWPLETLFLNRESEYIDYDDVYSYKREGYDNKYDGSKSVINNITFIEPNISVIELKDGAKISCLFMIKENDAEYKNNFILKFVDTDREEFFLTISEIGGTYIFNYSFSSLNNFFDRDDNYGKIRVKSVNYNDKWQTLDHYNIKIIGVLK